MEQGALDLGDFGKPPAADALISGVHATLQRLEADHILTDRHRGLVELLRAEAVDYAAARGIARTNYARLIGDHLTMLLALPAPVAEEEAADAPGARVTKLSEFIRTSRGAGADVRDPEAS